MQHYNSGDLVLNTAQMRSAAYVQQLRVAPERLDRNFVINAGVAKAVAAADKRRSQAATALPGARGRPAAAPPPVSTSPMPENLNLPRRVRELQNL